MEKRSSIPMRDVKVDVPSTSFSSSSTDLGKSATRQSAYSISVTAVDLVNHVLIICVTVFLLYYSLQSFTTMNLHVTLCTLGYVLLMSEAIVVLAGESILTNFLTRRAKSHVHWILQILGLICTIAGVVVMYKVKSFHFRSVHALLGIASVIIMVLLAVCGYPVFIAAKLRNLIRPVIIKFCHNLLGICCFVLGMASQCYGYEKGWLPMVSEIPNVQLICIIITALITVLSLRSSLPALCKQFVTMFRFLFLFSLFKSGTFAGTRPAERQSNVTTSPSYYNLSIFPGMGTAESKENGLAYDLMHKELSRANSVFNHACKDYRTIFRDISRAAASVLRLDYNLVTS